MLVGLDYNPLEVLLRHTKLSRSVEIAVQNLSTLVVSEVHLDGESNSNNVSSFCCIVLLNRHNK